MAVAQYAPSPPVVDQSGGGGGYQLAEQDYDGGEGDYADYSGYEDEMGGGWYIMVRPHGACGAATGWQYTLVVFQILRSKRCWGGWGW